MFRPVENGADTRSSSDSSLREEYQVGGCIRDSSDVSIMDEYDVVVVGGGVAGVSAAIQAKREGCRTLLLEKGIMLGGLATLGLVGIYLPLCDGNGQQVAAGLAEELLHLSIKYSYNDLDPYWLKQGEELLPTSRYQSAFAPMGFALSLDEIIQEEQVDVLFDAVFSRIIAEDLFDSVLIVETKAGRVGFRTRVVVDATGDADVLFRAGAPCIEADNWLSYWGYTTSMKQIRTAVETGNVQDAVVLHMLGGLADGSKAPDTAKYKGTCPYEITRFVLAGRKLLLDQIKDKIGEDIIPLTLAAMPQLRTTRRLSGLYELTTGDAQRRFADSIGCIGDWREAGPVYEIPYRSLVCHETPNIISAGRCISAAGGAWEVTRVIPAAAVTGQAAGCAAAMAVEQERAFADLELRDLQERLESAGVITHNPGACD